LGSAVSGADKRLKPIDIEFMRRLHQKVNLIPVIAKADTLTEEEVSLFKQRVSLVSRAARRKLIVRSSLIFTITVSESLSPLRTRMRMKRQSRRTRRSS
jgi:hypothetical protein